MPSSQFPVRAAPRQARSRQTVEDIITAAAQVLAKEGYDGASTNKIAAKAGVGIGSLYRYFTDKEEIVTAVVGRVIRRSEEELSAAMLAALSEPFETALRTTLLALVSSLERDADLVRVLLEELPRSGGTHRLGGTEQRMFQVGRAALVHLLGPLPATDIAAISYLGGSTLLALSVRIALERPPEIERELLVDHATRLLSAWLGQYRTAP
ncbi:TetR/AcrR family transcriptional regulator [Smaragdicoccus niigatensis]|uniref:TetR/AcrR family transcriptional regulator n=1 Tax=Smaragdicoccus niigatensis TaxID=359359 RepID=UPI00039B134D|nr:TetR/AcrR family transcriptional regulator [Smaragdicoccus niigatensis]